MHKRLHDDHKQHLSDAASNTVALAAKAYLDESTIQQYYCVVAEGAARERDAHASVGETAQGCKCKSQTCKGERGIREA